MKRPEIIAELSCNHGGQLGKALRLVDEAAKAGADGIKIQCWHPDHMVAGKHTIAGGQWDGWDMADLYREAFTPWPWIPAIFERARLHNLQTIASVFDKPSLGYMQDICCPRYKIASFEMVDTPLIEAVAATGKPIIISTGMADEQEIWQAIKAAGVYASPPRDVTLLHCVSEYPAPAASMRIQSIPAMRKQYRVPVGLSDHSLGTAVAVAATALGATMIEKHFTLRRADGGPDATFSIEPQELGELVRDVRTAHDASWPGVTGPNGEFVISQDELKNQAPQRALRRSLYWRIPKQKGDRIFPDDMFSARPALGIKPSERDRITTCTMGQDVYPGEPVSYSQVT